MKNTFVAAFALLSLLGPGAAVAGKKAGKAPRQVELTVTSEGFQPEEVKTRAGEPLRLVITRKTDRTCAKEIVIQELGINQKLPLDQAVTIDITPKKDGQLRYGCSMDMITGVIIVE